MFQQCYFKHNNNEVTLTRRKTKFRNFASIFLVTKVLEKKKAKLGQKDTGTTIFNAVSRLNYQISTFLWQFTFSYSQNTD